MRLIDIVHKEFSYGRACPSWLTVCSSKVNQSTYGMFVLGCFFFGNCCLAHLSLKLKWAFLITCCLSCPSACYLLKSSSEPRTTEPISTKLGIKHPWVKGIKVWSNDRPRPFFKGRVAKIHWKKPSFPEPLDHLWTEGIIQNCSNEWPRPFKWRE